MSRFYVYELWNPIKNEIFYVGKSYHGSKRLQGHLQEAKDYINKRRKSSHKINTILKILREGYHIDFKIVYETDDEQDALNKEIELIKKYGRRSKGTGPLTNMCDGGTGIIGYKAPQWLKQLHRKNRIGEKNPMYGQHHSEKSRKQISHVRKTKIDNGEIIPTKHSIYWKNHLKNNNAGGKSLSKAIHAIDSSGIIFMTFESTGKAAQHFVGNHKRNSNIGYCATKYKHRKLYGYFWRYVNHYDPNENFKILDLKLIEDNNGKKLKQINPITGEIIIWNSVNECCNNLGYTNSGISRSCNYKTKYKGYIWEYIL